MDESGATPEALGALVDGIALGVVLADAEAWQLEYANEPFVSWFPNAVAGTALAACFPTLNEQRARRRLEKGRAYSFETELKQGARAIVLKSTIRALEYGGRRMLLVETSIITKQKEQEHMLDSFAKLADRNKLQLEKANAALAHKNRELDEAYTLIKAQRDRMQRELEVARQVQQNMLPQSFTPRHDSCTVAAALKPALEVGGDFFDFFYVDEERLCFLLGDVSDKGAASGLFMAAAKTLLKTHASRAESTAGIVSRVNRELATNNGSMMFVTLYLAILDLRSGEVVATNAGHDPPFVLRRGAPPELMTKRGGVPLGVAEDMDYGEHVFTLQPGDMMVVYSDGVTEAASPEGALFGRDRLATLLAKEGVATPEAVVRDVVAAAEAHEAGSAQSDDMTIVSGKFHGA
jgi:serine phosphatase RsbU (regulator of sigma subunit)